MLKTENCVICGKKAKYWQGHVIAKERMALGNYINKKIIAGFCDKHGKNESDSVYYGNYTYPMMGKCIPLFSEAKKGDMSDG